jgi:hypothetical protein
MPSRPAVAHARWLAERLLWWLLLMGVGYAWYLFGIRLARSFGPNQLGDRLGPAAGLMLAAAVTITLWRWATRDAHRSSIEAGTCPRCQAPVTPYAHPPIPGVRDEILRGWHCDHCGLEDVHPLTPSRDAS